MHSTRHLAGCTQAAPRLCPGCAPELHSVPLHPFPSLAPSRRRHRHAPTRTDTHRLTQVRFMARGFKVSGDHAGQSSAGLRWPYGPVGLITPFNFPLEIPVLQLMGALYMGNKPLLHVDHRVSLVIEQFVRLLHDCGMPMTDVDLLHGPGTTMGHILDHAKPRSTLFTGATSLSPRLSRFLSRFSHVSFSVAACDWHTLLHGTQSTYAFHLPRAMALHDQGQPT